MEKKKQQGRVVNKKQEKTPRRWKPVGRNVPVLSLEQIQKEELEKKNRLYHSPCSCFSNTNYAKCVVECECPPLPSLLLFYPAKVSNEE